ncbi:MFS transporter [Halomarina oriensis]|uniref:MFS transporter n=2 Tax=Halomarina oriensis TaxID=671145 RepID=A0A6B0GQP1_9EURY|nr:MFS transporter [Halomarina oriensis]MWG34983.1 MFS transporter [Halomarina oriensis]
MSLWFSASAVAPDLVAAWDLSAVERAWLTNAVQVGFVVGALLSAALTLSDTLQPRVLVAVSAWVGAAATLAIALVVDGALPAIALRFLTGVALAGVYPPGMKLVAGWFRARRGLAIGTLVGALTVGSALPHLLRAVGGVGRPQAVLLGAAGLAVVGGLLALRVEQGPYQAPTAPFDPRAVRRLLSDRPSLLANLGYFGHMWELYAVWTWIPAYLAASAAVGSPRLASGLAFLTIGVGAVGAVVAGSVADDVGRTTVTSASMVVSGAACLGAGVLFDAPLVALVPFLVVWGATIVADSAQFSAALTELAEAEYVGTALTLQTAVGFLVTTVSIQVTPLLAEAVGWRWAFAPLVVGPVVGTAAMLRLRGLPAARKLAGGRG